MKLLIMQSFRATSSKSKYSPQTPSISVLHETLSFIPRRLGAKKSTMNPIKALNE